MGSLHDIIEKEISVEGEHIFFIIELMKKKKKKGPKPCKLFCSSFLILLT